MTAKITTKTQYAVAAMLELAKLGDFSSITKIATSQAINPDYMSMILSELRRKNLVISSRGPKGGYKIERPTGDIAISEIMEAVGESIKITRCNNNVSCTGKKNKCLAHKMWQRLEDNINSYLSSITLKDIITSKTPIESITESVQFSISNL